MFFPPLCADAQPHGVVFAVKIERECGNRGEILLFYKQAARQLTGEYNRVVQGYVTQTGDRS